MCNPIDPARLFADIMDGHKPGRFGGAMP